MKICINRKPVIGPWGGGNLFVTSFCETLTQAGHQVVHTLEDNLDFIFMQDPRYSDLGISVNEIVEYKRKKPSTKVIHRVNECDARKGTHGLDKLLRACSQYTDHTIFVSEWMRQYHLEKGWKCDSTSIVYNGVNLKHFRACDKIENGKVNIVTHHWSDHPLKGADIYDALDEWVGGNENFTFTYIGRCSRPFKNSKLIPPLSGQALGDELGKYDIYVSGSRFDPGPNHVIESLACGIPTYVHHDGGGAAEFAGKHNTYTNYDGLVKLITRDFKEQKYFSNLAPYSWESCVKNVMNILSSCQ